MQQLHFAPTTMILRFGVVSCRGWSFWIVPKIMKPKEHNTKWESHKTKNQPIRYIMWKLYDLFPTYLGANIVASNKVDYHLVGTNYRLLGSN